MKSYKKHIRFIFLFAMAMLGIAFHSNAQLKIGDDPSNINQDAILEMQTNNKGMLLPRVALTSTTNPAPLTAFVNGMLVYDTVTINDIIPGIYYCDGTQWVRLTVSNASSILTAWGVNGNAGTNPANNFIGTSDNNPLLFKTNGNEHVRVTESGKIGIGTNTPATTLHIKGQLTVDTLTAGDASVDKVLVVDQVSGLVKKASIPNSNVIVQKSIQTVTNTGQTIFNTPSAITDPAKISLYRNGVVISFTVNNNNSIIAELPCVIGDEIRIIQLL